MLEAPRWDVNRAHSTVQCRNVSSAERCGGKRETGDGIIGYMTSSPDRRQHILEAAAELFATHGVAHTTMRDIGTATALLPGSLYHYFRSKDGMLGDILARYMADIQRRFRLTVDSAASPGDAIAGLIHETLAVIEDHPHPTAIYQNDRQYLRDHGLLTAVDESSRVVRACWMDTINAAVADGTLREDLPPEVFYRAMRDALWSTNHWPKTTHGSSRQLGDFLTTLFLDGGRR